MLRCLFWNQSRKNLASVVAAAALPLRLDIIAVCEASGSYKSSLKELNRVTKYHATTGRVGERFQIFTRFPPNFVSVRHEADRFIILDVTLPAREPFLLMVLHGPSKGAGWTATGIALELSHYAASLRETQAKLDRPHAVVVGDFNANPYEPGMVGAAAFNTVMDARQLVRREIPEKTVQGRKYSHFYNPMWNLWGDCTPGPPATYYYDAHTQEEAQWHMLDQVIVSPAMVEYLNVPSIRVIDQVGEHRLVTAQGRPRKAHYSDHLPLYFELML